MADLNSQITEARKHGYTDDEILSHLSSTRADLAPKIREAQSHGYGASDIVGHLSGSSQSAGFGAQALKFGQHVLEGIGASVLGTVKGVRDLGYKATMHDPPKTFLGMEGLDEAPDSVGGKAGKFIGEAMQFAVPMAKVSKATKALSLGSRIAAEAAAGGAISAAQTGGDPRATAVGALGGAAGPLIGAGAAAAKNGIVRLASRNPEEMSRAASTAGEYAADHGVPMTMGQRTGNETLIRTEQLMASRLGSAGRASKFYRGQQAALANEAQAAADRINPQDAAGAVEAGHDIAGRLKARTAQAKDFADKRYDQVRSVLRNERNAERVITGYQESPVLDAAGKAIQTPVTKVLETPVNLAAAKQQLRPLYEELSQTLPITQQQSSPGFAALKQLLEGPDSISAETADKNLGAIKALVRRAGRDYVPSRSQGIAMKTIDALTGDVNSAMERAGGGALDKLAQARAAVKNQHEVAELLSSLPDEPAALYQRLVQGKDRGVGLLSEVKRYAPNELRDVGKTFVQGLVDRMTENGGISRIDGVLADWRKLGPQTKALLFDTPKSANEFERFLNAAKYLTEMRNRSGTAHSLDAVGSLEKLYKLPVNYIMGRVLFEPSGAQALAALFKSPPTSAAYRSALATVDGIMASDRPRVLVDDPGNTLIGESNGIPVYRAAGSDQPQAIR